MELNFLNLNNFDSINKKFAFKLTRGTSAVKIMILRSYRSVPYHKRSVALRARSEPVSSTVQ